MTVSHQFSGKMGVTMPLLWITLAISVLGSNAAGVFSVLYSPESLEFGGSSKTLESLLKEVYSASLGLSVEENSAWDGLSIKDPFNTPEAIVEVYIDGITTLGDASGPNTKNFPIVVDEYEPDAYDAVKHRIKQHFHTGGNKFVNINLNDPSALNVAFKAFGKFDPIKIVEQSPHFQHNNIDEDYEFLYEIQVLKEIIRKVNSGFVVADNKIDFYNIRFRSLHALSDFHGPNSVQTKEAKKMLGEVLQELSTAFIKAYDGSVLVTAVTTDVEHTRRTRQADGSMEPYDNILRNLSDNYTADYAAMFNIMLWFGIVFVFSLIAIVYSIMDMDPGRDSIIYRMTSTRMKKDN